MHAIALKVQQLPPWQAALEHVRLARMLLENEELLLAWLSSPSFPAVLEALFTTKLSGVEDLERTFPDVWWAEAPVDAGCSLEAFSARLDFFSARMRGWYAAAASSFVRLGATTQLSNGQREN